MSSMLGRRRSVFVLVAALITALTVGILLAASGSATGGASDEPTACSGTYAKIVPPGEVAVDPRGNYICGTDAASVSAPVPEPSR